MSIRKWIAIATGVLFAVAPVIVAFTAFPNDLGPSHRNEVMLLSAMIGWGVAAPPA
jgi:hypothetical protein